MPKEKQLYRETYKKPWPRIRGKSTLACVASDFKVVLVQMQAAGRVLCEDGVEREYVDVRFYTEEK